MTRKTHNEIEAHSPTLVIPIGHTNDVTSVAFAPDGRYLLTGSTDQTAKLWDWEGRELATFSEGEHAISSLTFSPDGKFMLTGSRDSEAKIWNLENGQIVLRLKGHQKNITSVAWSPNGKRILTGSGDQSAKVWNAVNGKLLFSLEDHPEAVRAVAWSPDGRQILTGTEKGTLSLWNARSRKARFRFKENNKGIYAVTFSPDGKQVLIGSDDKTAKVITSTKAAKVIHRLSGHKAPVRAVAWSPDGKRLLSGSDDGTAQLWNASTGKKQRSLQKHSKAVRAVVFSADGKYFLTGSRDQSAILWKTFGGAPILSLRGYSQAVTSLAVSKDEQLLLTGLEDHTANLWSMEKSRTLKSLKKHTGKINDVAFSPKNKWMLTGSDDRTAKLWDAVDGAEIQTFAGHIDRINTVAFSPDGRQILTGSYDRTAKVWDIATGEITQSLEGHSRPIFTVAFSPDGNRMLSGSSDKTARVWEKDTGTLLFSLEGHTKTIRTAAFSPDGTQILTGSNDASAKIWDANSGELLFSLEDHKYDLRAVAYAPDSKRIATAAYDETIKIWDAKNGTLLLTLSGHDSTPNSVIFSPDGHRIISASRDNMIKIWDSFRATEIATLIQFGAEDWVVTTPSGLFDASPRAMELMHYIVQYQDTTGASDWIVIELDQLKERYYEPELIPKIMGYRDGNLRDVSTFNTVQLFPKLNISLQSDSLKVELLPRNGGIGKLSLFINNKEILEDANPNRSKELEIPLKQFASFYRHDDSSTLTLRVFNEEGWLKSKEHQLAYTPEGILDKGMGPRPGQEPNNQPIIQQHLHAIVVGTSTYRAPLIRDLAFPDKDAEDMAHALALAGGLLFDQRLNIQLFTTSSEKEESIARKANIKAAFEKVAEEAKPHDVLVVYFSGHGANYGSGDKARFYYLTRDLVSDNLHDPAVRKNGTISSNEITEWIKTIPASKQVLILDTCHSGKVVDRLSGGRSLDQSTKIRALDRMKDRTGMFVLAGSAADRVSYEASIFGQGLLTYSLLLGMKGAALQDNQVDVSTLFQFARDSVPQFAGDIMVQQEPVIAIPRGGESFPLGIVDQPTGSKIRLASPKQMLTRTIFQDQDSFGDPLNLAATLDLQFRLMNAKGKEAPLLFIEVPELPGAARIRGLYRQEGGNVEVRAKVFTDGAGNKVFTLKGEIAKINELSEKITAEVIRLLALI